MTQIHSLENSSARTTVDLIRGSIAIHTSGTALKFKVADTWVSTSWTELGQSIDACATALDSIGILNGDMVAIISENEPAWLISDTAIVTIGACTVGIYPTLPPAQIAYILKDCGAKAIFVQDTKQREKVLSIQDQCPKLKHVIQFHVPSGNEHITSFDAFLAPHLDAPRFVSRATEDGVAVLIYTSGTTGEPKGAMLTHNNLVSNAKSTYMHLVNESKFIGPGDVFLSFLPLAHSFERIIHLLALSSGAATVYSGGVRNLMDEMQTQHPTIMGCVPRVYESIQEKIIATAAAQPERNQKLFNEMLAVGKQVVNARQNGQNVGPILALRHKVLDSLVAERIRTKFGGAWRFLISGGAALNPETARFFHALGFNMLEGYGLTETSPVISINSPNNPKIGSVGTVISGGEIRIAKDGEVCYRGENVMKGYYNNLAATQAMIDEAGWLYTGDIGTYIDGYLKITDRKKDIVVLTNGKNVSPLPIESALKESPYIAEVVLLGDKQNVCTALIIPLFDRCIAWGKEQSLTISSADEVIQSPEIKKMIKGEIDRLSGGLADFEKIRKFTLLNTTFTIDGGELTPTLKIKRRVIYQKFASEIATLRGE